MQFTNKHKMNSLILLNVDNYILSTNDKGRLKITKNDM